MIKIDVNQTNGFTSIVANGHAGYAPVGQDIVCAAVSAILATAILGLEEISKQYPEYVGIEISDE